MASTDPQVLTVRGRLSFPNFTYAEALKRNTTSKFPKKEEDVRPDVQLLMTQAQLDKLITHLKDVFFPWCLEQDKLGDKGKSKLNAAQVKKLTAILEEQDWADDPLMGLINPVYEKTLELFPEAAASVKVNGFKGVDLEKKVLVRSEDQLRNTVDDIDIPSRGLILPAADTTVDLYPGANVAATINLFAFLSGKQPGVTANTSTIVFTSDNERFGGGGSLVDEEDIFLGDDEDDDSI